MKTLLFCTSYMATEKDAMTRYKPYIEYYSKVAKKLGVSSIVLIDDGSPIEVLFSLGVPVYNANMIPDEPSPVCVISFRDNLGRSSVSTYPGWWRSFTFSSVLAEKWGITKLVHIESDAYVLSCSAANAIKNEESGWLVFWTTAYRMPETSLQVICKRNIGKLRRLHDAGMEFYTRSCVDAEHILEYTGIVKNMVGDRYGEEKTHGREVVIPDNADYCCQCDDPLRIGIFEKSELLSGIEK